MKAENLEIMTENDSFYNFVTAIIDGTQFDAFFLAIPNLDRMGVSYFITEPNTDFEKVYEHFVTYFTKIYGETNEELSTASEFVQILKSKLWRYPLNGAEYVIELHIQKADEKTQFVISVMPTEAFTM